jgi:hypothetical protein
MISIDEERAGTMRMLRALILACLMAGVIGGIPGTFAKRAASLTVAVAVTPSTVTFKGWAYVSVATSAKALCTSHVKYNDGSIPTNWSSGGKYYQKSLIAGSNGVVAWHWQQGKRGISSGEASVTCKLNGATSSQTVTFKVS